MGQSIIPAENCEHRPVDWADDDSLFAEPKPVVLTGKAAAEFADMVLSPPPKPAPALVRAFERHRKTVISE